MIQKPVEPGQPIPTAKLPTRCPKCGLPDPSFRIGLDTRINTLSCKCGYEQAYLVK